MFRFLKRLTTLAILAGIVWGVLFLSSSAFASRWRQFVVEQLEGRGIYLDFTRLTIGPVRGLVARNVRVFNDAERKQLIAAVDGISLDFDLGKLLKKEVVIESLNLSQTSLSLPIDPEHPELAEVSLKNLTARVILMDDRLDVRKAEGELEGMRLSLTGSVKLSERDDDPDRERKARENALKRLAFIRENRQQIQSGLKWLERFQFEQKPLVVVEVNGDAEKLQELDAKLTVSARGLGYGGYSCDEIEARAEYRRGLVDLQELRVKDALGVLEASGTWQVGGESVNFRLTSSADIPGLASAFFNNDKLREIVFYEPPNLAMDGTWHVKGAAAASPRPLSVMGRLQCGRFTSRGEIFDGMAVNFGVEPEGFYMREGALKHKTGSLTFQTMYHTAQDFKFRATLKMDPHVFLPFIMEENAREVVNRFTFREDSDVFVTLEGSGPRPNLAKTKSAGRMELRDFAYKGVDFVSVSGAVEFEGPRQTFRDLVVQRTEGGAQAREVHVDDEFKWVRLTGVYSTLDPIAVLTAFSPKTAPIVERYKLPASGTEVGVAGVISWRNPDLNDYHVSFRALGGTGVYPLWGKDYLIRRPVGELGFKKHTMSYDVKGMLHDEPMSAKGTAVLQQGVTDYTVSLQTGVFPYPVFGETLPFREVRAEVRGKDRAVDFDVKAKVMGGGFAMKGVVDTSREPSAYRGEIKIDALSFKQFAQIYSPEYETEGDLTGHFNFTGRMDEWKALKGGGVLIIVNGNLYAIPVLGPLTPLLGAMLPKPIGGYNVAKEANCTFKVADGFIVTEDMEALTSTFRIISKGAIDFIRDDIDFTAEVRVRGLPGIVFLPVSRLLEYKGEGTVGDPKWKPRLFGLTGSDKEGDRAAPTKAELDAAVRDAESGIREKIETGGEKSARQKPTSRPGR